MNNLKFLLLTFCLIIPHWCFADEEDSNDPENVPLENEQYRPRSASDSNVHLKCIYRLGSFIFTFEIPEGTAKARVTNLSNGKAYSCSFSTFFEYSLTVGNEEGSYEIFVETSRGSKYIGYYTIVTH